MGLWRSMVLLLWPECLVASVLVFVAGPAQNPNPKPCMQEGFILRGFSGLNNIRSFLHFNTRKT